MPNLKTNKNSSLDNQIIRNVFCVFWPRNVYGPWHQTRKIWFLIKVKCFFLILNINISHQKFLFLNNEKMSKKNKHRLENSFVILKPKSIICHVNISRFHFTFNFHMKDILGDSSAAERKNQNVSFQWRHYTFHMCRITFSRLHTWNIWSDFFPSALTQIRFQAKWFLLYAFLFFSSFIPLGWDSFFSRHEQ